MPRRIIETRGDGDADLDGLPDPEMMLREIGQAVAASLAAAVVFCACLQWAGAF